MTLYDYLFAQPHIGVLKKLSWKSCILQSQSEEEKGHLLADAIKNLEWRVCTSSSTNIPDRALSVIEIEVANPQYMYFVPSVLFQNTPSDAIILFAYQDTYKLCVNETIDDVSPVFSPWFELEGAFGRNEELIALLKSVTLDSNGTAVWEKLRNFIAGNEATYITLPKFRCMVYYLIRLLDNETYKHGDKQRIERLMKDNCVPYKYFKENSSLRKQRLQEKDEAKRKRQYRVFDLIYDLDQLWDVIVRDGWLVQRLQSNGLTDIRRWIEKQQAYFREYPDSTRDLEYGDRSKVRASKYLPMSGWYMVDFLDRVPKGRRRSGDEMAAILPTYHPSKKKEKT